MCAQHWGRKMRRTRMVRSGFNDSCHELDGEAEEGSKNLNVNVYGLQSSYRFPLASLPPSGLKAPGRFSHRMPRRCLQRRCLVSADPNLLLLKSSRPSRCKQNYRAHRYVPRLPISSAAFANGSMRFLLKGLNPGKLRAPAPLSVSKTSSVRSTRRSSTPPAMPYS